MPQSRIHYFSATGNSRLAAEVIGAGLRQAGWEADLRDIRTMRPGEGAAELAGVDFLGFVFPIFAFRAAIPMEEHIRALPPAPTPRPVFLAATYAGWEDRSFMRLRDLLIPLNYVPVVTTTLVCEDAWTVVRVPGFIYDKGWPTRAGLDDLQRFARTRLPEAWHRNREAPRPDVRWLPFNPLTMLAALFPLAVWRGQQFPIFVRKALCTKCGICVKQCPEHRLRLDPYPRADGRCVGCYGCINSCPRDAINTWFTNGRVRYRGPARQAKDPSLTG